MKMSFAKMQALGNDFVVIDGINQSVQLSADKVRAWADRHRGIGFDQLLLLEAPENPEVDFQYRIFNADGTEVAQCGNGARCIARFIRDGGMSQKSEVRVQTLAGILRLRYLGLNNASASLGVPRFNAAEIPHLLPGDGPFYHITLGAQEYEFLLVNVGNPHLLMRVEAIDQMDVPAIGALLTRHPAFPEGINVGFVEVESPQRLRLRVYERGVGETQACGSGACAAAVLAQTQGWCQKDVVVSQQGGELRVQWGGFGEEVWISGAAEYVYKGELADT
jgi:diaminopimelate epimerase